MLIGDNGRIESEKMYSHFIQFTTSNESLMTVLLYILSPLSQAQKILFQSNCMFLTILEMNRLVFFLSFHQVIMDYMHYKMQCNIKINCTIREIEHKLECNTRKPNLTYSFSWRVPFLTHLSNVVPINLIHTFRRNSILLAYQPWTPYSPSR